MNRLNGFRRETGCRTGDSDDIRLRGQNRGFKVLPWIWRGRGIEEGDFNAFPFEIGCQLEKSKGGAPHPETWKDSMREDR